MRYRNDTKPKQMAKYILRLQMNIKANTNLSKSFKRITF